MLKKEDRHSFQKNKLSTNFLSFEKKILIIVIDAMQPAVFHRKILFYQNYFFDFYASLDAETKYQVNQVIHLLRDVPVLPTHTFKYIPKTRGIYEVKVKTGLTRYTILSFFYAGQLILLADSPSSRNEWQRKYDRKKAEQIRQQYFDSRTKARNHAYLF